MKYSFLVLMLMVVFGLQSCKNNTIKKDKKITVDVPNDSAIDAMFADKEKKQLPVTNIKFDKEIYNFGECVDGQKIRKIIEFTNTGKNPLVIEEAWGSCGCTVPTFDKEPLLPGKKGKLIIQFDSKNKTGEHTKGILVQANTLPPVTTVQFSVKVNKKEKKGLFN